MRGYRKTGEENYNILADEGKEMDDKLKENCR
jgi:hypothetical protein